MTRLRRNWIVIAACMALMIGTPMVVSGFEVAIVWAIAGTILAFTLALMSPRPGP